MNILSPTNWMQATPKHLWLHYQKAKTLILTSIRYHLDILVLDQCLIYINLRIHVILDVGRIKVENISRDHSGYGLRQWEIGWAHTQNDPCRSNFHYTDVTPFLTHTHVLYIIYCVKYFKKCHSVIMNSGCCFIYETKVLMTSVWSLLPPSCPLLFLTKGHYLHWIFILGKF